MATATIHKTPSYLVDVFSGARLRVGIVVSKFNRNIGGRLLEGALQCLNDAGFDKERIGVFHVPGVRVRFS